MTFNFKIKNKQNKQDIQQPLKAALHIYRINLGIKLKTRQRFIPQNRRNGNR